MFCSFGRLHSASCTGNRLRLKASAAIGLSAILVTFLAPLPPAHPTSLVAAQPAPDRLALSPGLVLVASAEMDASATDQERLILRIQRQLNSIPDHPAYLYEIRRPLDAPAIIWMDWTSHKRDAYELHYFTAIDYIELERITLLRAQHLAQRRLLDNAATLLEEAVRVRHLANAFERASIAIFESDLANAELWATTAYELSRVAAVVTGAHAAPLSPVLAKAVDYLFLATDAFVSWHQVGASTALKEAVTALAIKLLLTEIPVPVIEAASDNPFVQSFNRHFAGRTFEDALADGATALIEWDLKPYVLEAVSSPAFKEELRKQFVAQLVSVTESGIESIVARADATIDQIIRGIELGLAERGELDLLADANCDFEFTKVFPGQMACGLGFSQDSRLIIDGRPVTDVVQPWGKPAENVTIYPLPRSRGHAVVVFGDVLSYVVDIVGRRATEVFVAKYGPDEWISWGPDDRYVALLGGNEGLTWLHVISLREHTNQSVPTYDSRVALVFDEESFGWLDSNSFRVRLAECKGEYCGETTLPGDGTSAQFHVSEDGIGVEAIDDLSKVPVDLARMIAPSPESAPSPAAAETTQLTIPDDRIELDDGTVIMGAAGAVSLPFASAFGTLEIAIGAIAGFADETLTLADGSVLKGRFGDGMLQVETARGRLEVPAKRVVAFARSDAATAAVGRPRVDEQALPLSPMTAVLTGQVLDNFEKPLPGATVQILGSSLEAQADAQGRYELPYVPGSFKVGIRRDGYDALEFSLSLMVASSYPLETKKLAKQPPRSGFYFWDKEDWIPVNQCSIRQVEKDNNNIFQTGVNRFVVDGQPTLVIPWRNDTSATFLEASGARHDLMAMSGSLPALYLFAVSDDGTFLRDERPAGPAGIRGPQFDATQQGALNFGWAMRAHSLPVTWGHIPYATHRKLVWYDFTPGIYAFVSPHMDFCFLARITNESVIEQERAAQEQATSTFRERSEAFHAQLNALKADSSAEDWRNLMDAARALWQMNGQRFAPRQQSNPTDDAVRRAIRLAGQANKEAERQTAVQWADRALQFDLDRTAALREKNIALHHIYAREALALYELKEWHQAKVKAENALAHSDAASLTAAYVIRQIIDVGNLQEYVTLVERYTASGNFDAALMNIQKATELAQMNTDTEVIKEITQRLTRLESELLEKKAYDLLEAIISTEAPSSSDIDTSLEAVLAAHKSATLSAQTIDRLMDVLSLMERSGAYFGRHFREITNAINLARARRNVSLTWGSAFHDDSTELFIMQGDIYDERIFAIIDLSAPSRPLRRQFSLSPKSKPTAALSATLGVVFFSRLSNPNRTNPFYQIGVASLADENEILWKDWPHGAICNIISARGQLFVLHLPERVDYGPSPRTNDILVSELPIRRDNNRISLGEPNLLYRGELDCAHLAVDALNGRVAMLEMPQMFGERTLKILEVGKDGGFGEAIILDLPRGGRLFRMRFSKSGDRILIERGATGTSFYPRRWDVINTRTHKIIFDIDRSYWGSFDEEVKRLIIQPAKLKGEFEVWDVDLNKKTEHVSMNEKLAGFSWGEMLNLHMAQQINRVFFIVGGKARIWGVELPAKLRVLRDQFVVASRGHTESSVRVNTAVAVQSETSKQDVASRDEVQVASPSGVAAELEADASTDTSGDSANDTERENITLAAVDSVAPIERVVASSELIVLRANANANVRSRPDRNAEVLGILPEQTVVAVTRPADDDTGWHEVTYRGRRGYVVDFLLEPLTDPASLAAGYRGEFKVLDTSTIALPHAAKLNLPLHGIDGLGGDYADRMNAFIREQGGRVECEQVAVVEFRCRTAEGGIDLAQVALLNGAARAIEGAPDEYLTAEQQAREAKRGIWANTH